MTPMRALVLSLTLGLIMAAPAQAQPDRRRPPARETGVRGDMTPDELREFIRQRSAMLERQQKMLDESMRMLDEGKPVDDVRAQLREAFAEDLGRRRGAFRDERRERMDGDADPEGRDGSRGERPERRQPTPDEVMSVLRDLNPRLYERLERVRVEDEREFHDMLRGAGERVRRFIDEKREHPDRFETRVQTMRLDRQANEQARAVAAASGADRGALEAELRGTVSRLFDLRATMQADDIGRLGARLDAARQRFERMAANRDDFVERHTADLIERAEGRGDGEGDETMDDRPPPPPGPPER